MAANREAQRKATHTMKVLQFYIFNTESYSVQQRYMYIRGHNQIEAFPTKYSYEALTSNLPLIKTDNLFVVWRLSIHAVNVLITKYALILILYCTVGVRV